LPLVAFGFSCPFAFGFTKGKTDSQRPKGKRPKGQRNGISLQLLASIDYIFTFN
jgi:hypothetical protein